MSTFLDGPAQEANLLFRRAPNYLRVVVSPTGKWDALDQLDDEPKPRETIYVYRRVGPRRQVHLNFGSVRNGTGFYELADYRHVPDVDGETVRATDAWRDWCRAQAPKA